MTRDTPREKLTRSVEDYLKAIFHLTASGGYASTSDIAESLGLAPPSVSGMVKRLSDASLLAHVPYHGVQLTDSGRREALRMIRRHRIIESYLIAKLEYDWASVHDEAERLEHAVSDVLVERMAAALGHPTHDPHGEPIPTARGEIDLTTWPPLDEMTVGTAAIIRQVVHDDPERLRFLDTMGLYPGTTIEVVARQPFDGPTTIRVLSHADGELQPESPETHTLGHMLALGLLCEPV